MIVFLLGAFTAAILAVLGFAGWFEPWTPWAWFALSFALYIASILATGARPKA